MFNAETTMSPADYAAISGNNNMWGDGAMLWWIIIIICLFNGNLGYGGSNGAAENYVLASDFATLQRQIDSSTQSLERKGDGIANGLCDGFYTQARLIDGVNSNISNAQSGIMTQMYNDAMNRMQDTFALQTAIGNNLNAITSQITNSEFGRQASDCLINNAIATGFGNLKYDIAAQDCATRQQIADVGRDIIDAQRCDTQAILGAIYEMRDSAKDEKIATLQNALSDAKLIANNNAQTIMFKNALNDAVKELNPTPQPSYTVPAPFPYVNCGCNC